MGKEFNAFVKALSYNGEGHTLSSGSPSRTRQYEQGPVHLDVIITTSTLWPRIADVQRHFDFSSCQAMRVVASFNLEHGERVRLSWKGMDRKFEIHFAPCPGYPGLIEGRFEFVDEDCRGQREEDMIRAFGCGNRCWECNVD